MRYISHRGNLSGVKSGIENTLESINLALVRGYDVEIDLWFIDGMYYLGHDSPECMIYKGFILENAKSLWCHAKDIPTLNELLNYPSINCFFHQKDDCVLTSHNYIWTYFNKTLTERSILLKFEKDENFIIPENIFGICSDNIEFYRK